jgi:uncharacterized integral membrane protein
MVVVYVLIAVIGAGAAVFAIQNIDPVVIRFFSWRIEGTPLSLVMLVSIMVGVVFTGLVGIVRRWKLRSRIRQLETQVTQLQAAGAQRVDIPPR